jgi:hypothetical protein
MHTYLVFIGVILFAYLEREYGPVSPVRRLSEERVSTC